MVNILTKVNMPHFNRFVWWGTGMGMLVSCLCGAGIVAGYYAVQSSLLSYRDKAVFSGTFSLIAALFLTGLAVQFLRFKDVEVKYRRKMAEKTEGVKSKEVRERKILRTAWTAPRIADEGHARVHACDARTSLTSLPRAQGMCEKHHQQLRFAHSAHDPFPILF